MATQKTLLIKQPEVGQLVHELRRLTRLTQGEFGVRVGVTYETVSRWENGRMQPSTLALRQLEQLVRELAQSLDDAVRQDAENLLSQYFVKDLSVER